MLRPDLRPVVSVQCRAPNWEPLLTTVGERLAGWFMWMHEGTFADGSTVQAYKHHTTRRYLFLDDCGQSYREAEPGSFVPFSLSRAIEAAFAGWRRVDRSDGDVEALESALVAARGENAKHR